MRFSFLSDEYFLPTKTDLHDIVLRFNDAPTNGYEQDVGNKTTIRVVNSQVIYGVQAKIHHLKLFNFSFIYFRFAFLCSAVNKNLKHILF